MSGQRSPLYLSVLSSAHWKLVCSLLVFLTLFFFLASVSDRVNFSSGRVQTPVKKRLPVPYDLECPGGKSQPPKKLIDCFVYEGQRGLLLQRVIHMEKYVSEFFIVSDLLRHPQLHPFLSALSETLSVNIRIVDCPLVTSHGLEKGFECLDEVLQQRTVSELKVNMIFGNIETIPDQFVIEESKYCLTSNLVVFLTKDLKSGKYPSSLTNIPPLLSSELTGEAVWGCIIDANLYNSFGSIQKIITHVEGLLSKNQSTALVIKNGGWNLNRKYFSQTNSSKFVSEMFYTPRDPKANNFYFSSPLYTQTLDDLWYPLKLELLPPHLRKVNSLVTIGIKSLTEYRKDYLKNLIDSIYKYYPGIRILVGDDSYEPDDSAIRDLPDVEFFELSPDAGISQGRNELIKRTTTKYFLNLDDDWLFNSNTNLLGMVNLLENNLDVDLVSGHLGGWPYNYNFLYNSSKNSIELMDPAVHPLNTPSSFPLPRNCSRYHLVHNFYLARVKKLLEQPYDPAFKVYEHEEYFLRAVNRLGVVACSNFDITHERMSTKTYKLKKRARYYYQYLYCFQFDYDEIITPSWAISCEKIRNHVASMRVPPELPSDMVSSVAPVFLTKEEERKTRLEELAARKRRRNNLGLLVPS